MLVHDGTTEKGVTEERVDLPFEGETVPGLRWRPEAATGPTPTILIGHGGTQHKRAPNVLGLARRFVRHLGVTVYALDAPNHGDRIADAGAADAQRARLERSIAAGAGRMELSADDAKAMVARSRRGVEEWKALVDLLDGTGGHDGRLGYWGVSMGTLIGLPFVASEPRVQAAVLGLAGMNEQLGGGRFADAAASLTIPILFLFQWDDELMSRESGLALYDAIGSAEKALHVNPGGHVAVPLFERDAAEAFFRRHLLAEG